MELRATDRERTRKNLQAGSPGSEAGICGGERAWKHPRAPNRPGFSRGGTYPPAPFEWQSGDFFREVGELLGSWSDDLGLKKIG